MPGDFSFTIPSLIGSIVMSKVNPCPDSVLSACRPFLVDEIEHSSQALLVKTNGGYCLSARQGSAAPGAAASAPGPDVRRNAPQETMSAISATTRVNRFIIPSLC